MSYFGDDFVVPAFADVELGEGQRWSTWPATTPTERGPEPRPDWVVTSAGAVDTELGVVKSGKEAELYLIERAVPGASGERPGEASVLAAKRYRTPDNSDFHRSSAYTEGRRVRRSRDRRAMERKSSYGRTVAAGQWAGAEFGALCWAWQRGLPVPYPVQISHTEILMEFIGRDGVAAPRLANAPLERDELIGCFDQVVAILHGFASGQCAHGDLSPYNLLVHDGRVVVIDLPQIVDVIGNPNGFELLERDVRNVCTWFERRGVPNDPDALFAELCADAFG
ncbi:serine protein kinase RIO [Gryllotalpicola ginsengisoli]|uniref:serine protein kinase RIO n=1 Tax=Gryllotalpicola ginsengisoli TaxID=444608 RepID=UPI0003B55BBC|nr:RIO1 family regulatory kinase/ATPase [Gryllotalpicola ginsengisoli]